VLAATTVLDVPFGAERLMGAREYRHWRLDDDRSDLLASYELPSIKQEPRYQLKVVRFWKLATHQ